MRLTLLAAALLSSACQPQPSAPAAPEPAAPQAATLPTGATLSYIRSNQDGTMPEQIYVHVVSPTEVHVTKMVSPCTDAAYVTATFDPATHEATRLVGGRLQKDGTQLPQAWLQLTPDRKLEVRLGDPASLPAETHDAPASPWRIYDFDLAEFALFGPREPKDFTFGVALAWPDGTTPLVRVLGEAQAKFIAEESRDGRSLRRFKLTGAAFDSTSGNPGGSMLFDAQFGYVAEASFAKPNHTDYKDFMLKLTAIAIDNGDDAWREVNAAHWKGC